MDATSDTTAGATPGQRLRGQLLVLRGRSGLTQRALAALLGVSEDAVQNWEAGRGYPSPARLQALIAIYVQRGVFPAGGEEAEARALWVALQREGSQRTPPFDASWFATLLPAAGAGGAAPLDVVAQVAAPPERPAGPRLDWGEAPDVAAFQGRQAEVASLTHWLLEDRCRVVALLGLGGIGKTALATRVAHDVAPHYEALCWRSLRNAPLPEEWLSMAIAAVAPVPPVLPEGLPARLALLLDLLRERRCLLVLDNLETVLEAGESAPRYRAGYEGYGEVLRQVGESAHQSSLLLTTREAPPELALLAGEMGPVRSLRLGGLDLGAARTLLADKGLDGDEAAWQALVGRYGGNPLALRVVGQGVVDLFGGEIAPFLAYVTESYGAVFGGLRQLLDDQVARLSPLGRSVLYWLAVEREPVGVARLAADLGPGVGRGALLEALAGLGQRSLLERGAQGGTHTLQPVVLEYATERLVEQIGRELAGLGQHALLEQGPQGGTHTLQPAVLGYATERLVEEIGREVVASEPRLLVSYALVQAQARDYVRRSQERLIVQPLLEQLHATAGSGTTVERRLLELVDGWQGRPAEEQGYGPGNVLNLLRLLRGDLRGLDLSRLSIRQAYLAEVEAQDTSLAGAHLTEAVLAEAFTFPTSVALSADGVFLAAGSSTGEVWLWRVADRMPLLAAPGHSGEVVALALSGDGGLLASGGTDGTIRLWEAPSGRPVVTLEGHAGGVNGVALAGDGGLLASGGQDGTVRLWEAPSGRLLAVLEGHTSEVRGVTLSGNGRLLASGSLDGTVRLWEMPSGQPLATLAGHSGGVLSVALSGDGQWVASGGMDGTVRLWEAASGQPLATLQGHASAVWNVALSGDGRLVASGDWDRMIRLWEAPSGRPLATLLGHRGAVYGVALSADGSLLASGGQDGAVKLWEAPSGRPLATLQGHSGGIHCVALSADGGLLASGGEDWMVRLWEARAGQPLATLQGHSGGVWVALSADGRLVASGGFDGAIKLWEVAPARGRLLATLRGHSGVVFGVALSADGTLLASGGMDGTIRLWEAPSGRPPATLQEHSGAVLGVALSADGGLLTSGGFDGAVKLWDAPSERPLATLLEHTGPVRCVALSGDGGLLASGGADGTIKLWATAPANGSPGRLLATLLGHTGGVYEVALSGDGGLLASCGADGTIKLWATAPANGSPGRLLATLLGHTGPVRAVALSADGQVVATGGYDGTIRLWEARSGACLHVLQPERRYERLDITGLSGVTEAQRAALLALGAVERQATVEGRDRTSPEPAQ